MARCHPASSGITRLTDAHFSEQTGKELSNSLGPSGLCIMKEACLHLPKLWSTVRKLQSARYYFSPEHRPLEGTGDKV